MYFILLVRHGETTDKQHGQSDFDRVLTPQGRHSVELLSAFLMKEKIFPKIILSSSAIRTMQTVKSILGVMDDQPVPVRYERELYQGSDDVYLELLSKVLPSFDIVMVVGHNPSISSLIGVMTGQYSIALYPGQAALIVVNSLNEITSGKLVKLMGPFLK